MKRHEKRGKRLEVVREERGIMVARRVENFQKEFVSTVLIIGLPEVGVSRVVGEESVL